VTDGRLPATGGTAYAVHMEVRVGPVASASVVAWVRYARRVLDRPDDGVVPTVDPATVDEFRGYLDTWEAHAVGGDPFLWIGEVEPERLEFLAHGFARIVEHLVHLADHRGVADAPADGDEFYQALVFSIIDALDRHGASTHEFSEQLRDRWPGIRRT